MTSNAAQQQSSVLPPAQPTFLLRGHGAQIHAVAFIRRNSRLLTGDADGWVSLWNTTTKRAVAVWKPHEGAILGFKPWAEDKIITHGRDSTLKVWQLRTTDEPSLSTSLPIDDTAISRQAPWLLHSLAVNTLNFCTFAMCTAPKSPPATGFEAKDDTGSEGDGENGILVAVPGINDKGADLFHLPSEKRRYVVAPISSTDTGMIMTLSFLDQASNGNKSTHSYYLISGYESGHAAIHSLNTVTHAWNLIYLSRPHSQPLLSLAPNPTAHTFFTSSADAVISSHPLPGHPDFVDPRIGSIARTSTPSQTPANNPPSLLSQAFATAAPSSAQSSTTLPPTTHSQSYQSNPTVPLSTPLKSIQTKHSGQQSLSTRNDGRIFATAGWDGRIRVYSTKTLKEVAVLKWHKEGCYALDFAEVLQNEEKGKYWGGEMEELNEVVETKGMAALQLKRDKKAQETHWVAAGSKDGKVSLWDIF